MTSAKKGENEIGKWKLKVDFPPLESRISILDAEKEGRKGKSQIESRKTTS
jgi:hypothetical protein